MKKESFLLKIWNILWPLFVYLIAQNLVTVIGIFILSFFGGGEELYYRYGVLFVLAAALICIPIYWKIYRKDEETAGNQRKDIPVNNRDYLLVIFSGAALALAMNNVIALTPLPVWFTGFEDTNQVIYGGGLLLQILSAGMFACIVEEVSMRGVVYGRMKRYFGKTAAMLLSALVFGIYHLNVVQGVYAFVLGLYFVWLYERYQSLWASCIAHMSANLFILFMAASPVCQHVLQTMVGFCLTTCISLLIFYYSWRVIKESDPKLDLEFVEKEPDTLEKLTEEYKAQEREDSF